MDSPNSKVSQIHESVLSKPKSEFFLPHKRQAIREALDHWFVSEKYQNGKNNHHEVVEGSDEVCKACQTFTTHMCQTCKDYYCSNDCEHPSWRKHELKCNKLPSSEVKSPPSNKDTEANEKLMISNNPSPFRKLTQQFKSTPVNGTTTTSAHEFSGRKSEQGTGKPAMGKFLTKYKVRDDHRKHNHNRTSLSETDSKPKEYENRRKRSFGKNQIRTLLQDSSSSGETESMNNSISSKMSKAKELNIKINEVDSGRREARRVVFFYKEPDTTIHWVMNEDDMDEFESIHNTLAKECDDYEWINPEVGLVCGCKYSDEWYRARVMSLQPKCRVHYIDYGNTAEASSSSLKKLPPEIKMVKNLVYQVLFDENTPDKYKNKDLSGKTLKIETKQITSAGVEVVGIVSDSLKLGTSESKTTENGKKEIPTAKKSSMSLINSESKGVISLLPGDSKVRYGLIIPEGSEQETEIDVEESKSLNLTELNPVKAAEGDYVMVIDYYDQRRRGKVVSTLCSTYYVLLIDYGIVIAVENVYQLPGRRVILVHLGANVIIDEILSSEKMKNIKKPLYQVTGNQDTEGKWPCELKETSSKEVIAKGYIQSPPEEGVTVPLFMPMKSGSICEMSVVTGVKTCYVRPLDQQSARKSLEMSVKMAEFLVKADPLSQPPEIGKMYAAKNKKDDCFHRAVVRSARNDKYDVLFVDHGTMEKVEMKDLKPLPISIKVVPFFAAEVTLSGITVESLSDSANLYLDKLIENNLTLVLRYSDDESDEVVLKEEKSGIIVNEVIENPEKEKNDKDEGDEKFDENDIEDEEDLEDDPIEDYESGPRDKSPDQAESVIMKHELKMPNIHPNVKYNLVLQHIDEREFFSTLTFWMANMEDETFSQVSNVVNSKIGKYCSEVREPYRPRQEEMCLAMYEGDWYRALTLSVKNDNYQVFFVDFGNTCTLKPKEIRKMKREFMEYPAWAFKCIISSVGKLIGKPGLKKRVYEELRRRVNSVLENVIVSKHEFEIYYVIIPEIEEILCG